MPAEKKDAPAAAPVEETVSKAEYDRVIAEYEKLAKAFNKLMKQYNDMFVASLFTEDK